MTNTNSRASSPCAAGAGVSPSASAQPHDAHVQLAHKTFRDCGFSISAMQYKRPPEALAALREFNKVPDDWQHPFAWNYHPNEWCARRWAETGKLT